MPNIRVTRANAPRYLREQVLIGQVFSQIKRDGLSKNTFAAIGHNGRFYSVGLNPAVEGRLHSTANGKYQVAVVGKWRLQTTLDYGAEKASTRAALDGRKDFPVFRVANEDPKALFVHLGKRKDGSFLSLNLVNKNHAVTDNGTKRIVVVGNATFDVNIAG